MNKQVIDCCKCKEDFEWDEPEGYENTDLMPDGAFTGAVPGEWICLDCMMVHLRVLFQVNGYV